MNERPAPLLPNLLLTLGFLLFVVVGIVTVLVPELASDDDPEGTEGAPTTEMSPNGDASE